MKVISIQRLLELLLPFQIISGQHIPKPDESLEGEVVDPYVLVKIVGHPRDRASAETDFVRNNGGQCNCRVSGALVLGTPF